METEKSVVVRPSWGSCTVVNIHGLFSQHMRYHGKRKPLLLLNQQGMSNYLVNWKPDTKILPLPVSPIAQIFHAKLLITICDRAISTSEYTCLLCCRVIRPLPQTRSLARQHSLIVNQDRISSSLFNHNWKKRSTTGVYSRSISPQW